MIAIIQKHFNPIQWVVLGGILTLQAGVMIKDLMELRSSGATNTASLQAQANPLPATIAWKVFGQGITSNNAVSQLFHLLGVFESKPTQLSTAIIGNDKNDDQTLYKIGDRLSDGSTVYRIEKKEVLIKRPDGQIVSIKMEEIANDSTATPAPTPPIPNATLPLNAQMIPGFNMKNLPNMPNYSNPGQIQQPGMNPNQNVAPQLRRFKHPGL